MPANILILEDNPENLQLMTYLLEAFGHRVTSAIDGSTGLQELSRATFDLIICDIHMRIMDGYGVASTLKSSPTWSSIPLIAVTALAMVGDRDKMLSAGFSGYISKPIDPETFLASVEVFLPPNLRSTRQTHQLRSEDHNIVREMRAKVLVVDDDPVNIHLHMSLLLPLGYQVHAADSADQAYAIAIQSPPDLIISDVRMRAGSGYDFVRSIKSHPDLCNIPCVLISSTYRDEAARQRGLQAGAVKYLFRPIDPDEFLAEVEACLQK